MVRVTNYSVRERKDGTTFVSLELTGGLELLQSATTHRFYASVRKCNVPATFTEDIARTMLGQEIPGEIVRVQVEPYTFENPRTGELMTLTHSYAYRPAESEELVGETKVREVVVAAL